MPTIYAYIRLGAPELSSGQLPWTGENALGQTEKRVGGNKALQRHRAEVTVH